MDQDVWRFWTLRQPLIANHSKQAMPVAGQKGSEKDACKTEACSIQTCLSKNGYNVSQCSHQVDRLKKCCEKHQARALVSPCIIRARRGADVLSCCLACFQRRLSQDIGVLCFAAGDECALRLGP